MKTRCSCKRGLVAFSILIIFLPVAQGQTTKEIAKKTLPSVVVLVGETGKGKSISLGSGFFVRRDVIATNYHVIKGNSRIYAKIVGQSRIYPIRKVLAFDSQKDLVLLRIGGVEASPLWIGNSCIMGVGDTVYVVGNPKGLEGTFSQGIVSGIRKVKGNRYLQITAALSEGSSGGPILNEYGEVIGIAVASVRDGQNLNFAVSGQDLAAIIVTTVGEGFGVDILADLTKCLDEGPWVAVFEALSNGMHPTANSAAFIRKTWLPPNWELIESGNLQNRAEANLPTLVLAIHNDRKLQSASGAQSVLRSVRDFYEMNSLSIPAEISGILNKVPRDHW